MTNLISRALELGGSYVDQRIQIYGDSRAKGCHTVSDGITALHNTLGDWSYWAAALSGVLIPDGRFNFGVPGDTVEQAYYRLKDDLPTTLGYRPSSAPRNGVAAVLVGTNSIYGNVSGRDALKMLRELIDILRSRGNAVIVGAEWARGDAANPDIVLTSAKQTQMRTYIDGIRNLNMDNVYVADIWSRMTDRDFTDMRPLEGFLCIDALHATTASAFLFGSEVGRIAKEDIGLPVVKWGPSENGDLITSSPTGSYTTNPFVNGSGGTIGANAAGVAPTGYTLLSDNAAAPGVTGSQVTQVADGVSRAAFRMVVQGTPAAATTRCASLQVNSLGAGNFRAGDKVRILVEARVAAGWDNIGGISAELRLDGGLRFALAYPYAITGRVNPSLISDEYYGTFVSVEFVWPTVLPTSVRLDVNIYPAGPGAPVAGTIDILRAALIPSPAMS